MKLTSFVGLIGMVSPIIGFLDTGAVYVNRPLDTKYVMESGDLVNLINDNACLKDKNPKVSVYNIDQLGSKELLDIANTNGTFVKHVHYNSADNVGDLARVCDQVVSVKTINSIDDVDLNDQNLFIIQESPKTLNSAREVRDEEDEEDEDISAEFAKAKSMAAEAEAEDNDDDDDQYHILDEETPEPSSSESSSPDSPVNGSLFNTYQFFTSGIFMCLIVSFMLLFVLTNALSWVSSIDITYKSFDKQVDFEKKTE